MLKYRSDLEQRLIGFAKSIIKTSVKTAKQNNMKEKEKKVTNSD